MEGDIFQSVHIKDCTEEIDVGSEIPIENIENSSDDADDCYFENEYHSAPSSEDNNYSSEEVDEVECLEGAVYNTNFDNPK